MKFTKKQEKIMYLLDSGYAVDDIMDATDSTVQEVQAIQSHLEEMENDWTDVHPMSDDELEFLA